jgi:DNA polymerase elongation subunit (family B)
MIKKLGEASNLEDFMAKIPEALAILRKYADMLTKQQIRTYDLVIRKHLSKSPSGYTHNVLQAIAAKQLEKAGFQVHSGQTVQYVITKATSKRPSQRIVVTQLLKGETKYDAQEYLHMLFSAAETLFGVFGYTKDRIQAEVLDQEKQITLS